MLNVPVLGGGRPRTAPVQHVAIRSADIVETARAVSAQGLSVLPVPGNYYEDLAARLGLDAAALETYRRGNILYDEDPAGRAMRHFYVTSPRAACCSRSSTASLATRATARGTRWSAWPPRSPRDHGSVMA